MEEHAVETGRKLIDENSASGVKLAEGILQIYPFFMRNRKVTLETLLFSAYSVSASASASTRDPR